MTYLEAVGVLALGNDSLAADAELVGDTEGRETVDPDRAAAVDVQDLVLARVARQAGLAEVLEEAVQPSACAAPPSAHHAEKWRRKGDGPKTRMFFEFWTTSAQADGWFARFGSPSAAFTENGVGCAGEGW